MSDVIGYDANKMALKKFKAGICVAESEGRECSLDLQIANYCESLQSQLAALEAELARYEGAEVVGAQFQDSEGKWFPFLNQAHQQRTIESGECKIRYLIAKPTKGEAP